MLNKELGESTRVACSPISDESAAPCRLVNRQSAGMESAAKTANKQTGALNQHLFSDIGDSSSVSLKSIGGPICDQTSRANPNGFSNDKFPKPKLDQPDAVEPDSECEMASLSADKSADKFRSGSLDQRSINNQSDSDSDSVQLLDECNSSETDSDLQIVSEFPANQAIKSRKTLNNTRNEKSTTEKSAKPAPLIELASSNSDDASSNPDVGLAEDTDDSDHSSTPKHDDDECLSSSVNSSNFVGSSLNSQRDYPSDPSKKRVFIRQTI